MGNTITFDSLPFNTKLIFVDSAESCRHAKGIQRLSFSTHLTIISEGTYKFDQHKQVMSARRPVVQVLWYLSGGYPLNLLSLHSGNIRISSYRVAFPMPPAACNCCPTNPSPDRKKLEKIFNPANNWKKMVAVFRRKSGYPQSHGTFWTFFFAISKS